jgi:methylase of polypeptide subunit release factors
VRTASHIRERFIKANGVHYTPQALASFLADVTVRQSVFPADRTIAVLDPACGDGCLLRAVANSVNAKVRKQLQLIGYETDPYAAASAEANLNDLGVAGTDIRTGDFLESVISSRGNVSLGPLFAASGTTAEQFDIVISNPPYVRTQVLGAKRSQQLADFFELGGRIDLYHAFIKAISLVLRPEGVLGLLTSNRFMLIQSGASVRGLFRRVFDLRDLYDLGDTKLFDAAVLPAILVAKRRASASNATQCPFTRVYEIRNGNAKTQLAHVWSSVLEALKQSELGVIRTAEGNFQIERGELACGHDYRAPWSLSTPNIEAWLASVHAKRACCFGDIAQVRVGIKTTADAVFIRDDWDSLPEGIRPESELLRPLITHHVAARWLNDINLEHRKMVLYPHEEGRDGSKRPVNLAKYPRSRAYLEQHRQRLEERKYVIEAGRQWYELWVPQQPKDWSRAKVVYPDISEHPRFFLDTTGAVVNGDCYWITLNDGVFQEWLYLVLAVANSTFITTYYDTVFHNKLYAGRRRFMTQYVRQFPLPEINTPEARRIIEILSDAAASRSDTVIDCNAEENLDNLVWSSFGLRKEVVR